MNLRTTAATVALICAFATASPVAATASPHPGPPWSADWTSAMQPPTSSSAGFDDQTVRQVVRLSAGGTRWRIRLSNQYGTTPLRVARATIARTGVGASVRPGSLRELAFHGARSTTIPAGGLAASDPTILSAGPLEQLTITLYLAKVTGPATFHEDGLTTTYLADGDHSSDVAGAAFTGTTSHSIFYLAGVDVTGRRGTVVAFGDSLTNGHNSTVGADRRYSDALAERLIRTGRPVVNAGISGNLLLSELPCFGESGITRFRRDALDQPGVRTVIVAEGINDIWDSEGDFGCGITRRVTAEDLIRGYRSLIRAAHARGVRVIGGTITPFKADYIPPADFERAEAIRRQANTWIRTCGQYDGVADFAHAVADSADPQRLDPAYNSGDSLHPNDAGYRAMAAAVDLANL
ncbi:lysophospholipase L1-like esterase [Kribbella voronezhensis]|uniref:Lysophospholipase L1-like esterase n=1 Tax=Kribbella voronezhensis TaxID=2512212 RepID=A0A4R7T8R7_9ACTN|nr:SGNH/GDSL hydrolase family protein [Kribbella voronezhensis]TDU88360.1 lysophospholipase L1-like esterase [Kribbella voronezhensis]